MTLKVNCIPDILKLETLIRESKGKIFLQFSDAYIGLKDTNIKLEELLEEYARAKKQVIFQVLDNKDYFRFVNYMIGTTYAF
ncbi:MAG: hypothetical protein PHG16_03870 [Lachnospiraceae bacterium]|nr:hypothetical protein [Lachnospiraceae bacterium]